MSKRPPRVPGTRRARRREDWQVKLVGFGRCDEPGCSYEKDDPRHGFAYTHGLHERHGLPELHITPRSHCLGGVYEHTTVSDPIELGVIVNLLAWACIDGQAGPGRMFELPSHIGERATTTTFHFGLPGPREPLQAFFAHPGAQVVPVTWTVRDREAAG